jgi:hypothetical protein
MLSKIKIMDTRDLREYRLTEKEDALSVIVRPGPTKFQVVAARNALIICKGQSPRNSI